MAGDPASNEVNELATAKRNGPPPPPPAVQGPYSPAKALQDIPGIHYALEIFLNSQMLECEEHCNSRDPNKERLYYASGYGLIQCVKALMSYEDEDILAAIGHVRTGNNVAASHRKKHTSFTTRLAGYVIGSSSGFIKSMTPMERHAELVFAETTFEKALLGIVYSGDWLAFIKEALNMRSCISIYRQLNKFLETADSQAGGRDESIDVHFRSGVYLGMGAINLILSLMPGRLASLVELFGYHGDRQAAIAYLERAGGWSKESASPSVSAQAEGVRRSICDMVLLIFHLVLSSFTFDGIDISMAQKILDWNLARYPTGVFFLFGAGRLAVKRSQPARALASYQRALEVQNQYRNLHHISFWELAVANLSLWDVDASLVNWRDLAAEATWSKAVYAYGAAACLLQLGGEARRKEAAALLEKVPQLRQRIAGKSIPLEKFVARKARKFQQQKGRLALPALEFAYIFLAPAHAPRDVLVTRMLPCVDAQLKELAEHESDPSKYAGGADEYWDDLCLARFLEGVCARYVVYPDPDALADPESSVEEEKGADGASTADRAQKAFEAVLHHGQKIVYDHHLVYHAHYELALLMACKGDKAAAHRHLDLVLSGKPLEATANARKGKYSMENALQMRAHAALQSLNQDKRL